VEDPAERIYSFKCSLCSVFTNILCSHASRSKRYWQRTSQQ